MTLYQNDWRDYIMADVPYAWMSESLRTSLTHSAIAAGHSFDRMVMAMRTAIDPMRQLGQAMCDLDTRLYDAACTAWLQTHRRLPGSMRTRRLRKKRRDLVMRAYMPTAHRS